MSQEAQYPPIETAMRKALTAELNPVFLDVTNESPMHNTPKQAESHFRVLVVSDKFNDLTLIKVSTRLTRLPLFSTLKCIHAAPSTGK